MSKGIAKTENRRKRVNVIWCLLIIISSVLIMSNPGRAADLGLIAADRLKENPSDWIIIDARPKGAWLSGHIPGAHSFSWEDYTRTDEKGIPYRIMPPKYIAGSLGKMGINSQTPIAIYGDADSSWGGEGWACWVLTWMGHQGPIRLLDGGIQAWTEKNFSLAVGITLPSKQAVYEVGQNDSVLISGTGIHTNPDKYQLIDTRSTWEWIKGHLPKASHISWEKFYKGKNKSPLNPAETRALLEENDIDTQKPAVYYCTGGIRSAYAWMVHTLAGLPAAVNFEGGTEEWNRSSF